MSSTFDRKLPPVRLARAPLVLALFQARFPTVLKLEESYLPDIQERFREHYPLFTETDLQETVLAPDSASVASRRSKRWLFASADQKSAVVLTPDFVALEAAEYSAFEGFVKALENVLTIVGEAIGIRFVTRLGLRYVSRLAPARGETLSQYLHAGLTGIAASHLRDDAAGLRVMPTLNTTRVSARTEQGSTLVLRVVEKAPRDISLPVGVDQNDLKIPFEPVEGHTAVLDIDHFMSEQKEFDVLTVIADAWRLHEYVVLAFRQATTDYARKAWGAES
jgi:uncharacterized protein (TIGR04255 family)